MQYPRVKYRLATAAMGLLGILMVLLPQAASAQAAPVPFSSCPLDAFVTRDTGLYSLNLANGVFTPIGTLVGVTVNAAGFRQQDRFIYAWNNTPSTAFPSRGLVRIGQNGVLTMPFSALPVGSTTGMYVADIQPSTGYYVGWDAGLDATGTLQFIDVQTNSLVRKVSAPILTGSTDMAFHPRDGQLYTVNPSGAVYRINPDTGTYATLPVTLPYGAPGGYGAIFFDDSGTLYAYKSNSPAGTGLVVRIHNVDGNGTISYDLLTSAPTSSNLDGARCPFAPLPSPPTIALFKKTTATTGGPFGFTLNNTVVKTGSVTTTVAGASTQVDGDPTQVGNQVFSLESARVGQPLTITESSLPAGWKLDSAICRDSSGTQVGSLSGSTYTIPGADLTLGAAFSCEFNNSQLQAAIGIVKTNNVTSIVAGQTMQYQITIKNDGPAPANNAVVRDPATAAMMCSQVTCAVGSGGAVCPTLSVPALQSAAGVVLPTLPANSSLILTLTCRAN